MNKPLFSVNPYEPDDDVPCVYERFGGRATIQARLSLQTEWMPIPAVVKSLVAECVMCLSEDLNKPVLYEPCEWMMALTRYGTMLTLEDMNHVLKGLKQADFNLSLLKIDYEDILKETGNKIKALFVAQETFLNFLRDAYPKARVLGDQGYFIVFELTDLEEEESQSTEESVDTDQSSLSFDDEANPIPTTEENHE